MLALQELAYSISNSSEKAEAFTLLFKAHQGLVVMYFAWQDFPNASYYYSEMLKLVPEVTINDASKGIEEVLTAAGSADFDTFDNIYRETRTTIAPIAGTKAMLHKFNMKQVHDLYASREYERSLAALEAVHDACKTASGVDDIKSYPAELIQIYALRTQIAFANQDQARLRELFRLTKDLKAPVKEPQSQSILEELWGRCYANDGEWDTAYTHFENAFKDYQTSREAGKDQQCLKFLILANIMLGGKLNPFNSPEAKALKNQAEVKVFNTLRNSFDKNDVTSFTRALELINDQNDPFVQFHLKKVIWDFHSKAILNTVRSYRKIKLATLSKNLQIDEKRCQRLVVALILDGKIFGKIDQVKNVLDLSQAGGAGQGGGTQYQALDTWTRALDRFELPQPTGSQTSKGRGYRGGMMSIFDQGWWFWHCIWW